MKVPSRPLLLAGVIGPLVFIAAFLIEGITRPGYSAWRNFVSQLATGDGGWMQVVNFLVCGTLVAGFAIGLRRALGSGRASIAAPILLGLFALALIVAGLFATDPALGYPVGAPEVHTTHGMIHGLAGLAAFSLLPAAAFAMAWRFSGDPSTRRWAVYSASIGVLLVVCFIASTTVSAMDASGVLPNAPTGFLQRVAIIGGWTWIAMVALRELRLDLQPDFSRPF
ncbi:MAG TPA: DUF998 domain-containing protein [Candidatus Nitrosopolaris sp.]|nr:DUF998 domain-containing protein [Candidatus Nitrosopolaris sp.]